MQRKLERQTITVVPDASSPHGSVFQAIIDETELENTMKMFAEPTCPCGFPISQCAKA